MKKKLIIGFVLMTLIFIGAGLLILWDVNSIIAHQTLQDKHEDIISRYNEILYNFRSAQAQLYRHQAGFTRDIDSLTVFVINAEDMLSIVKRDYYDYKDHDLCNSCHTGQKAFNHLDDIFKDLDSNIDAYEDKISFMVTSMDIKYVYSLEKEAVEDGVKIINIINYLRHASFKMNERLKKLLVTYEYNSKLTIFIAVTASFVLAALLIIVTIRSVTGPVNILVKGIEKLSTGDYESKVKITSADEIGFLAKTFNSMTDNLKKINHQRNLLLNELNELNTDLKIRVQSSIEELKITNEKLLRNYSLSTVGTFASGVAHELATPLASILSYLQMVNKQIPESDKIKRDMNIIASELQRCRDILRGMLDFARAPEKEKMPTNVNNILQDLLLLISYQSEYKNIVIKKELKADVPSIIAVPGQLKQVFMNVIINALQAMPEGGELNVSSALNGKPQHIVVTIKDTGGGISEEEMSKIFQPFYTSKKTGTGLGLSISYSIIKSHGGNIEVKNDHERGTAFYISLPLNGEV